MPSLIPNRQSFESSVQRAHATPDTYLIIIMLLLITTHKRYISYAYFTGKNKKKAKSQSKKKPPASASSSKRPYAREITLCQAYTHLCAGYFKVYF